MFKFTELKSLHLEITNNCQAACPMCARNIHGGMPNPLLKVNDWTVADFQRIINIEVLTQIEGLYFCGNFGDPIINKDLIDMCRYAAQVNPYIRISIHTNGSARTKAWWSELSTALPVSHSVVFALDGLADTHSIYRVGTNFDLILENARAFIAAGGNATWTFIKFGHNEHQVESAQAMATALGFKSFNVKNSSRFVGKPVFDVYDAEGNTVRELQPPSDNKMIFISADTIKNYKTIVENSTIFCQVQETKELYIDAHMTLFPCCFLGRLPYDYISDAEISYAVRTEMLGQIVELMDNLPNLNLIGTNTIKQVVENPSWKSIWSTYWNEKKLIQCVRSCGQNNFSKVNDQFINKVVL